MNYKKVYDALIQKFVNNPIEYKDGTEKHHIVPKCLGGLDTKSNLVRLPSRYHYIAHILLWKSYPIGSDERKKLAFAVARFHNNRGNGKYTRTYRLNSREYERVQLENTISCRERMLRESSEERKKYGLPGVLNPMYGVIRKDFSKTVIENNKKNIGCHWYNDGIKNVLAKSCPEGYVKGKCRTGRFTKSN